MAYSGLDNSVGNQLNEAATDITSVVGLARGNDALVIPVHLDAGT